MCPLQMSASSASSASAFDSRMPTPKGDAFIPDDVWLYVLRLVSRGNAQDARNVRMVCRRFDRLVRACRAIILAETGTLAVAEEEFHVVNTSEPSVKHGPYPIGLLHSFATNNSPVIWRNGDRVDFLRRRRVNKIELTGIRIDRTWLNQWKRAFSNCARISSLLLDGCQLPEGHALLTELVQFHRPSRLQIFGHDVSSSLESSFFCQTSLSQLYISSPTAADDVALKSIRSPSFTITGHFSAAAVQRFLKEVVSGDRTIELAELSSSSNSEPWRLDEMMAAIKDGATDQELDVEMEPTSCETLCGRWFRLEAQTLVQQTAPRALTLVKYTDLSKKEGGGTSQA